MTELDDDPVLRRRQSGLLMNRGIDELDSDHLESAQATLLEAARIDAGYHAPWFHLGLVKKRQREWPLALRAFVAAWERKPVDVTAELYAAMAWNIGISATIVRDHVWTATAWNRLGLLTPADLARAGRPGRGLFWITDGHGSLVLAESTGPASGRIVTGNSGIPAGTIVVHEAGRLGVHPHGSTDLPLFEALAVLPEASTDA